MKAIIVCVDFDDILEVTLPRNAYHFDEIVVVTAPHDKRTVQVVKDEWRFQRETRKPNTSYIVTDAFYRNGAKFNKGLAIEEALDVIGREGWIVTLDVDIILPEVLTDICHLSPDCLYGARRRMLHDPADYHGQTDWSDYPLFPDDEIAGCFQLFHAEAKQLKDRPWFGTNWTHAGGYDSEFEAKFRPNNTRWLPFEILHLGMDGCNWYGRTSPRLDDEPVRDIHQHMQDLGEMRRLRRVNGNYDHEKL